MTVALSLLCLPHDVLLIVLQQEVLGARELCYLEMCCTCLKRMIDDSVWKQAFLNHRHCNALREPECWKKEFARRDSWSHGWRQLVSCSAAAPVPQPLRLGSQVSAHTQKLRRFAMKMVSGSAPTPALPKQITHVVDAHGG